VLRNDTNEAIEDLTKAIELNPRYAEAYAGRGTAKADKRDFTGAIEDFTIAIELQPSYAMAYIGRAA